MDISNNDVTSSLVATGSRRKSGRAVKVPEKFVPDAPSSQPGLASAKRKRGGENTENDASDIEDIEEELDDSEGTIESAGEEELKETRRKTTKARRKPAAKKPKINGSASHEVAAAVKLPSRAKKPKKVAIADKSAEGLYGKRVCFRKFRHFLTNIVAEVFTSGRRLEDVASEFLTGYEEDKPKGAAELMSFVLKSAGCNIPISEHDINDTDNVEGRLKDLQEEFQEVSLIVHENLCKAYDACSKTYLTTLSIRKPRAAMRSEKHLSNSSEF
jgi:cohesin complex subunit SA-1/2